MLRTLLGGLRSVWEGGDGEESLLSALNVGCDCDGGDGGGGDVDDGDGVGVGDDRRLWRMCQKMRG